MASKKTNRMDATAFYEIAADIEARADHHAKALVSDLEEQGLDVKTMKTGVIILMLHKVKAQVPPGTPLQRQLKTLARCLRRHAMTV